jgi:hypothetical protein
MKVILGGRRWAMCVLRPSCHDPSSSTCCLYSDPVLVTALLYNPGPSGLERECDCPSIYPISSSSSLKGQADLAIRQIIESLEFGALVHTLSDGGFQSTFTGQSSLEVCLCDSSPLCARGPQQCLTLNGCTTNRSLLFADGLGSGDLGSGDFQMGKLLRASVGLHPAPQGSRCLGHRGPILLGSLDLPYGYIARSGDISPSY